MVLTTTDSVVTETMSRGVSHIVVALLDKHSNEQSLQRVGEYVAVVCTEAERNNGCTRTQKTMVGTGVDRYVHVNGPIFVNEIHEK